MSWAEETTWVLAFSPVTSQSAGLPESWNDPFERSVRPVETVSPITNGDTPTNSTGRSPKFFIPARSVTTGTP